MVGFRVHVGMGAFAAAVVLTLARVTDEKPAILAIPWSVIVMVSGVTVLTSLLEKTGGIDLFTTLLARFATHRTVTGLIALVTGLVSVYSSTSGVVLPAFLPSVPGLVTKLGGGNPLAIASSILIGGHLVDVSPLSTIGALCIASAPVSADRRTALQPGARLGAVDVGRGGVGVLPGLRKMVKWHGGRCTMLSFPFREIWPCLYVPFAERVSRFAADGRQSGLAGSPATSG